MFFLFSLTQSKGSPGSGRRGDPGNGRTPRNLGPRVKACQEPREVFVAGKVLVEGRVREKTSILHSLWGSARPTSPTSWAAVSKRKGSGIYKSPFSWMLGWLLKLTMPLSLPLLSRDDNTLFIGSLRRAKPRKCLSTECNAEYESYKC